MPTLRRLLNDYRTRFEAAFHYADPGPTRLWLIICAVLWGLWLLVVPGEISSFDAWGVLGIVGGERVVGPVALVVAVFAIIFDVVKSKKATVMADILLVAWWLFIAITLIASRPESPSVTVYSTLVGFGVWVIYRDADQI